MKPAVALVIPVYNEAPTLKKLVAKVVAIDFDKELVFVDDGSTDGSREMVAELECDNGGVTWPSVIVVYGDDWKILGSVDLKEQPAYKGQPMSKGRVLSWNVDGNALKVKWGTTDVGPVPTIPWTGRLVLKNGEPQLVDVAPRCGGERGRVEVLVCARHGGSGLGDAGAAEQPRAADRSSGLRSRALQGLPDRRPVEPRGRSVRSAVRR